MLTPILLRGLERIVISGGAIFIAYLGYRLFLHGKEKGKGQLQAKSALGEVVFSGVGPGLFFMAFASFVLISGLYTGGADYRRQSNPPDNGSQAAEVVEIGLGAGQSSPAGKVLDRETAASLVELAERMLASEDPEIASRGVLELRWSGHLQFPDLRAKAMQVIQQALKDRRPQVQGAAAGSLESFGSDVPSETIEALESIVLRGKNLTAVQTADEAETVEAASIALIALGEIGRPAAKSRALLEDLQEHEFLGSAARQALKRHDLLVRLE